MNRRSFIGSLLAGVVSPAFLPGAGRTWRVSPKKTILEVNPEWVNAPYEIEFTMHQSSYNSFIIDPYPIRYKLVNGVYQMIEPFRIKYAN